MRVPVKRGKKTSGNFNKKEEGVWYFAFKFFVIDGLINGRRVYGECMG